MCSFANLLLAFFPLAFWSSISFLSWCTWDGQWRHVFIPETLLLCKFTQTHIFVYPTIMDLVFLSCNKQSKTEKKNGFFDMSFLLETRKLTLPSIQRSSSSLFSVTDSCDSLFDFRFADSLWKVLCS